MTEEQLQELKEWHENDGELHQFQIDNLIETVERFNAIQKENAELSIILRDEQIKLIDIQQQNKRYREFVETVAWNHVIAENIFKDEETNVVNAEMLIHWVNVNAQKLLDEFESGDQ